MQDEERTEEASQRQLQKAREKGDVPKSREINAAVGLLLALLTLKFFGAYIVGNLVNLARETLTHLNDIQIAPIASVAQSVVSTNGLLTLHAYFTKVAVQIGLIVSPIFLVLFVAGILTNVLQVGPLLSAQALAFNFDKLNPFNGIRQILSRNGLIETLKALLKIILIGAIAVITLRQDAPQFQTLGSKSAWGIFGYGAHLSYKLGMRVAIASLLFAVIDLFYQRWSYAQKLRMTRHEVREERRESEIAPEVKRVIQERQLSLAQRRMMQEVPKADVVITNPTHIAVALMYNRAISDSPIVVAKGADYIAERIRAVAEEHDIPIIEDPPLAWALYESVELGDAIPVDLYRSVAQILARVYQMRGGFRSRTL